jgi:hypothetical protein
MPCLDEAETIALRIEKATDYIESRNIVGEVLIADIGMIARLLGERRPHLAISGIDAPVRPETHIPVAAFDGQRIPRADRSVDVVMFVDARLDHA